MEFLNFSFCIRKLAVAFYMINEIQPKTKLQNIVQCPFKSMVPDLPQFPADGPWDSKKAVKEGGGVGE